IGSSKNLLWELERAVLNVGPKKLILLITTAAEYERFRESSRYILPKPLPEYYSVARPLAFFSSPDALNTQIKAFVFFSPDWTPNLVRLDVPLWRAGKPLESALINHMQPVYRQIGLVWHPTSWAWGKIIVLLGFCCLIGMGFLHGFG